MVLFNRRKSRQKEGSLQIEAFSIFVNKFAHSRNFGRKIMKNFELFRSKKNLLIRFFPLRHAKPTFRNPKKIKSNLCTISCEFFNRKSFDRTQIDRKHVNQKTMSSHFSSPITILKSLSLRPCCAQREVFLKSDKNYYGLQPSTHTNTFVFCLLFYRKRFYARKKNVFFG